MQHVYQPHVRVRFAPSPTGMLHIGGLRTALFNFLFARHTSGKFLLRIEDTDKERSQQRYIDAILKTLQWCRLTPDEPLVIQSERQDEHVRVAEQLVEEHKAYYCYCTQQEVQSRVGQTTIDGVSYLRYDGFCRKFIGQPRNSQKSYVIRFAVPENCSEITVEDVIKGNITFASDTFDDFILVRSDGAPMYNFVVVVDDAFMRITHIIRGEEHLINTPKQILLYQACGYPLPTFGHLPLILGADGSKMSKRDAAANAFDYMDRGYLPEALCNYLVRLGWSHGDQEIFTLTQMVDAFTLDAISSKGALFDNQKLDWVNSVHLKSSNAAALYEYMKQVMNLPLDRHFTHWSYATIMQLIDLYKQRCVTLQDLYCELILLYKRPTVFEISELTFEQKKLLDSLITLLNITEFTHQILAGCIKEFCKTQEIKLGDLGPLIRVALTGKKDAPGLYDLMTALGKQETISRLTTYYLV
ncbi:MAG: glutamate--tRNA ligase [Candidatus Babeliaceae bacterium]|nr:glutamate--tRNA ligase [Candidatus Babeliaceae bacterium]